ncbi:hypothetical protein ACS0TY_006628 [Phlomoides rotata]
MKDQPFNYEYDGTTDPYDHLVRFENSALLHRFVEGVKCRVVFNHTLLGRPTMVWPVGAEYICRFQCIILAPIC